MTATRRPSVSESNSESDDLITPEYLESLIEKARQNAAAARRKKSQELPVEEEDIIQLGSDIPLPPPDPGPLPPAYFTLSESYHAGPSSIRDPDVEHAESICNNLSAPSPPIPPPELTRSGKQLTKKEKKKLKAKTAGPDWFDLPAPQEGDLPRLYREVEALRLRNQLDPKRFYRKDDGEGKGIKGLPNYFAIGTILPSSTFFGGAGADNLPRASRKRTIVDELVDDAEIKRYAKKKFEDLQVVRGAKGRRTLAQKKAMRRSKW